MKPKRGVAWLTVTVELATTVAMLWFLLPASRRRLLLMTVAQRWEKTTMTTARHAGSWGIDRELAGDLDGAQVGYGLAYGLMTGGLERARAWYEHLRSG